MLLNFLDELGAAGMPFDVKERRLAFMARGRG
jgi:hypothetical protein